MKQAAILREREEQQRAGMIDVAQAITELMRGADPAEVANRLPKTEEVAAQLEAVEAALFPLAA